jgi:transposase
MEGSCLSRRTASKAKARGYRTHKNFINMAYLILGKLDLRLPT